MDLRDSHRNWVMQHFIRLKETFANTSCIGSIRSDDWIAKAKPDIQARMTEYEEDQIEFSILSVVKDPLLDLIPALAENVRGIQAVAAHLKTPNEDGRNGASMGNQQGCMAGNTITGAEPILGLTAKILEQAQVPSLIESTLHTRLNSEILVCQQELCAIQAGLRASVRDELEARRCDEEKASARRHDYGPLALKLAQILARKPMPGYNMFGSKKKQRR